MKEGLTAGWQSANIVLSAFLMEVFGLYLIEEFASTHNQSHKGLESWLKTARANAWRSLLDIRKTYAGGVKGEYTVFNIAGNKYRLITTINYVDQTIVVNHDFSHAQYDRWNKK